MKRPDVERWAAQLKLAPSSVARVVETFGALMAAAVEDNLIARNPIKGARLPSVEHAPVRVLDAEQIWTVIGGLPGHLRAAGVLCAGSGLRQGEAMAVTGDRVDWLRRELRVDRQLWTPNEGRPVFAPPKTKRGYRTIALSSSTLEALSAHVADYGPGDEGALFHFRGRPISRAMVAKHMRTASARSGVQATWHDFRHHHASALLSAGVSPALVAERLGHDTATLLRTYAHVIRSDDDRVRRIVDDSLGALVSPACHEDEAADA